VSKDSARSMQCVLLHSKTRKKSPTSSSTTATSLRPFLSTTGIGQEVSKTNCIFIFKNDKKSNNNTLDLQEALGKLPQEIKSELALKTGPVTLKELAKEFETLCNIQEQERQFQLKITKRKLKIPRRNTQRETELSEEDQIAIEMYKLLIIKNTLSYLEKKLPPEQKHKMSYEATPPATGWGKSLFYITLYLGNVLLMGLGGYLGIQQILPDIVHQLSHTCINSTSAIVSISECVIFYLGSAPFLKQWIGTSETVNKKTVVLYNEQIQATEKINDTLACNSNCYKKMGIEEYKDNIELAKLFNNHIVNIKIKKPIEGILKKGIRYFFEGTKLLANLCNNYFLANFALKAFAASLVGTPLGLSIVIAAVTIRIWHDYAMRSENIYEILNNDAPKMKDIEDKKNKFQKRNSDFDHILENKRRLASRKSRINKTSSEFKESHPLTTPLSRARSRMESYEDSGKTPKGMAALSKLTIQHHS